MQTRDDPSVLPFLVPWLAFLALTVSMPACDLKSREAEGQKQTLSNMTEGGNLVIDAAKSEASR